VALRDALPAPERLLLVLSYHTGMRLGLLRGLRWSWVNLPEKRITIPAGTDKNRQPRTVPIYGDMGPYLEMAATQRKTCFPDCPYVVQRHGHQVVDIRKAWSRACEAIGLDDLHFHDLRRSAVRNMDRAGVPRDVAMRIIGHKTPAMFRRYNIISDRDLDDASKKLEAYRDRERKRVEGSTDAASSLPN
jgi:integrase